PLLGFALIIVLIELFYFGYMVSRGMVDKQVQIQLGNWGMPFSIALFLALGNAVLISSLWQTVYERTVYAGLSTDRRVRRQLYLLRIIRFSALILISFTLLLFLPYILESGWYLSFAQGVARSVPSLQGPINGFYVWAYGISKTEAALRYIASQLIAGFGTLVLVSLYLWRVRGSRGLSSLVRRRRLR
ncbi:MAG TPA: hypothetical protein VE177_01900, partial [Candidatus Binatus sp.]|nr:hypothetical protein [Candidatus Binatus sp.]